jgi:hypothetical protein
MKTPTKTTYRQGDVMLLHLDQTPVNLTPRSKKGNRVILAHGEATGHHHSILRSKADDFIDEGGSTIVVTKGAVLEHQEHTKIKLPDGTYEFRRQREYTPQAIRNVAD